MITFQIPTIVVGFALGFIFTFILLIILGNHANKGKK